MRNFLSCFLAVWAAAATLAFAFRPEEPACVIGLDKMNVFYIGVDNPVSILVRGVPEEQLKVETNDILSIKKVDGVSYNVRATTPGDGLITISGGPLQPITFRYRVKRIPDPVPSLGASSGPTALGSGAFKAQNGLAAILENFDFDANCPLQGYKVVQMRNSRFLAEATNTGSRFTDSVRSLIDKAEPGDRYIFEEIRVKCPGDAAARKLDNLIFEIQ